jgi:hypothetical protein
LVETVGVGGLHREVSAVSDSVLSSSPLGRRPAIPEGGHRRNPTSPRVTDRADRRRTEHDLRAALADARTGLVGARDLISAEDGGIAALVGRWRAPARCSRDRAAGRSAGPGTA